MTVRLSKIYTRTGDKGATLLATGERVLKSNVRIEAYGTVDELNATVGMLRDTIVADPRLQDLCEKLSKIQN